VMTVGHGYSGTARGCGKEAGAERSLGFPAHRICSAPGLPSPVVANFASTYNRLPDA